MSRVAPLYALIKELDECADWWRDVAEVRAARATGAVASCSVGCEGDADTRAAHTAREVASRYVERARIQDHRLDVLELFLVTCSEQDCGLTERFALYALAASGGPTRVPADWKPMPNWPRYQQRKDAAESRRAGARRIVRRRTGCCLDCGGPVSRLNKSVICGPCCRKLPRDRWRFERAEAERDLWTALLRAIRL